MSDGAGPVGKAPDAAHARTRERDHKIGARRGGDAHLARRLQHADAALDLRQKGRIGRQTFEDVGMLVRDHHQARPALEDLGQLLRVQQAFQREIDQKAGPAQRLHQGLDPLQRPRGSGRAHRDRGRLPRRRHHDVERPRAEARKRELGKVHIERARLRLGEDAHRLIGRDPAEPEQRSEILDPFGFDAVAQHAQRLSGSPFSVHGLQVQDRAPSTNERRFPSRALRVRRRYPNPTPACGPLWNQR